MYFNLTKKIATTTLILVLTLLTSPVLGTEKTFIEKTTQMEFTLLEGGSFVMGDILRKDRDASPPRRVNVQTFQIGTYEVTFDQFDAFCDATKRDKPADNGWGRGNRPVINVSWRDAVAFTKWLSEKSGKQVRLPSEAQWEYAARAGTQTTYWWGRNKMQNLANCFNCGSKWDNKMTAPVGSLTANPWGLHDMLGNVNEWTFDKAHEGYINAPATDEPWLMEGLDMRIVRGGGYRSMIGNITVYFRDWYEEKATAADTGFRVVILDQN